MLVLTRNRDEAIMIGDDIVITVVDIRGDKVRLGIAAPLTVAVHRQEVYLKVKAEGRVHRRDAENTEEERRPPPPSRPAPGNVTIDEGTMGHAASCRCDSCVVRG